jgi:Uncharacterized membrane protein (homolog of Drosophila rhomboid)
MRNSFHNDETRRNHILNPCHFFWISTDGATYVHYDKRHDEKVNNQLPTIITREEEQKECCDNALFVRGGGGGGGEAAEGGTFSSSFVELNPNYHTETQSDNRGIYSNAGAALERDFHPYHNHNPTNASPTTSINYRDKALKPLSQVVIDFFQRLHSSSPALYYGTMSSIVTFCLWQIPALMPILQNHFVCSQYNLSKGRYHTLITSALSHSTLSHLLMNLYGYLTFGKSIESLLYKNQISLGVFCIMAGLFSNAFFVIWNPHGSCIGLSGVALSLFAMDAKHHPSKEIAFLVKFLPIRLPAQYALTCLSIWSLVGMLSQRRDGVAHAAHLGGILFGMVGYECLQRGLWMQWKRKFYSTSFGQSCKRQRWKQARFNFKK